MAAHSRSWREIQPPAARRCLAAGSGLSRSDGGPGSSGGRTGMTGRGLIRSSGGKAGRGKDGAGAGEASAGDSEAGSGSTSNGTFHSQTANSPVAGDTGVQAG